MTSKIDIEKLATLIEITWYKSDNWLEVARVLHDAGYRLRKKLNKGASGDWGSSIGD